MVAHPGDGVGNKPPDIVKLCMDKGKDRRIVLSIGTEGVPLKEGSKMTTEQRINKHLQVAEKFADSALRWSDKAVLNPEFIRSHIKISLLNLQIALDYLDVFEGKETK